MKNYSLGILVFVGGITSLALEMCASRLLGAYFGSSLYIWAVLIGLVLLYLTAGYFLGGRFADRHPSDGFLCGITALAAFSILLIPFVSGSILAWSVKAIEQLSVGAFVGSLLGTVLLFAVPVILLGMVSPFAVRLATRDVRKSGRVSGSLYTLSTIGSILGAFLPALWLIPTFGVRTTMLILSALLFAASLWGLRPVIRPAFALTILALLIPLGPLKDTPNLVHHRESLYNYIQVTQLPDGTRQLVLNEGHAIHSVYYPDPKRVLTAWCWDYFLAAPFFHEGFTPDKLKRVGIIGLAGGTIAHQFTQVYGPNVQIDGVEIDPAIVDVGRQYFNMNEKNLHVYVQDGRTFLATTKETYDVIGIDAYQQPYIPFQLTTKEFFQQIRDHLSDNGTIVLNAGHTETDFRLVQAFVNTMSQVFPSVYTFNVPNTVNTVIMATKTPTSMETFKTNLSQYTSDTVLGQLANEALPVAQQGYPDGGIVFTDDRAPIEQITDQLLLNYIQQR